jgi:hypothetical protein
MAISMSSRLDTEVYTELWPTKTGIKDWFCVSKNKKNKKIKLINKKGINKKSE